MRFFNNKNNNRRLQKKAELLQLQKWLNELKEESKKKPIIVEGKKDSEALENFEIKTEQLHKPNQSLNERMEHFAAKKECILLFDLDRSGRKLHTKIKEDLQYAGVRVNSRFRNFLLARTKLRFIEGLDTYITNLQNY